MLAERAAREAVAEGLLDPKQLGERYPAHLKGLAAPLPVVRVQVAGRVERNRGRAPGPDAEGVAAAAASTRETAPFGPTRATVSAAPGTSICCAARGS